MRKGPVVLLLGLALASPAGAQERIDELDLPRSVADEVVAFFNDPATLRFTGLATVPSGGSVVGDVGVLSGPLTVGGRVEGDVIVINGDLVLEAGGRITGDALVLGGRALGDASTAVGGTLTVYQEPLRFQREGERIVRTEPPGSRRAITSDLGFGRSRFTVRAGTNYNRVEGLPVMFGPIIETAGRHPLRLEALGIWRSEAGFTLDTEELGYQVRVEQRLGTTPALALGATAHSSVAPVEDRFLTDLESSLSTFLLHKDFRDYFERRGWSVYGRVGGQSLPVSFTATYSRERHDFAPVGSPWTLRKNDHPWRPQPLVGQGRIHLLTGELLVDTRNSVETPSDGWFIRAAATRALDGDLHVRSFFPVGSPQTVVPTLPTATEFSTGVLDVRRYLRVGPDSDLALRAVVAGALGDVEPAPSGVGLPPQFQRALGGEGSLPGYRLFSLDCGARSQHFRTFAPGADDDETPESDVFAAYGCDRTALLQVEYRGHLDLNLDFGVDDEDDEWDWYPDVDFSPAWVAFVDVGRGWGSGPVAPSLGPGSAQRTDTQTVADVGAGFFLGDLGLFWTVPLHGEDRSVNFFVRIHRRF